MRILHYTLGLFPYRSGGLTRYTSDLMQAQSKNPEDQISLLYPGDISLINTKRHIARHRSYGKVKVYEIKNPSIVPLLHGVKSPASITQNKNTLSEEKLDRFYAQTQPEIFHLHTLMGLPYELLLYLKRKGVKIVFSIHDYFGLCPKVNFVDHSGNVCTRHSPSLCATCNQDAPSDIFLRIRNLKGLAYFKKYLPHGMPTKRETLVRKEKCDLKTEDYADMFDYYQSIYGLIDLFHFNSTVSQNVYCSYLPEIRNFAILPISHAAIIDRKVIKRFDRSLIRLGFIGSLSPYKGFPLLKEVCTALQKEGIHNWKLSAWGNRTGIDADCDRIVYCGAYKQEQLAEIFFGMDMLIVPSLCYETFGLVVLEALSFGVPVMVSATVGAKDIVKTYDERFIFHTPDELNSKLKWILSDESILSAYNKTILSKENTFSLDEHIHRICSLYRSL